MEYVPFIAVVATVVIAAFTYACWETKRNREHPELGPVSADDHWNPRARRGDRGEPPVSNDPGAGGFIDGA